MYNQKDSIDNKLITKRLSYKETHIFDLNGTLLINDEKTRIKLYNEAVEKLKNESFDFNFAKLSDNPIFKIDGIEYKAKDFYLRKLDNGTIYFSNLKDKKINLFTKDEMTGKIVKTMAVYKSSIFYQLYKDKVINVIPIDVDKDVFQKYANNWDGEINDKTFDNAIILKTQEYIKNGIKNTAAQTFVLRAAPKDGMIILNVLYYLWRYGLFEPVPGCRQGPVFYMFELLRHLSHFLAVKNKGFYRIVRRI